MASLRDYHYELPPELIAQRPAARRDGARLMVVDRARGEIGHRRFTDIEALLGPGDLLVVNQTRVVPARVLTRKATGGQVELLFHGAPEEADGRWRCLCLTRSSKALRAGSSLRPARDPAVALRVVAVPVAGEALVEGEGAFFPALAALGEVPLPPYIARGEGGPDGEDSERYQTVFAQAPGAVAAPTAGLHFTPELLARLAARGVGRVSLTLHVGPGTFLPVRSDDYERHEMMAERFEISEETVAAVGRHRPPVGRTVAVGTTTVRALEGASPAGRLLPGAGETRLFITPGHRFAQVDALLTNFHLPGSTLLLLVSAFAGRDLVREAYRQAVAERYRFYSYGDAMLIL